MTVNSTHLLAADSQFLMNTQVSKHFRWANAVHGLQVTFRAVSMPNGPIRDVMLGVYTTKKVGISEARKLFVECTVDLINRLNADKQLRVWLIDYPYTYKNIAYTISFNGLKSGTVLPPYITTVRMSRDEIVYEIWDENTKKKVEILRENYLDGVTKMQIENAESSRDIDLPG